MRRQLVILMVPITIVAMTVFLMYQRYRTVPTCFDGIQNQQEAGVDCGGECDSCRLFQTKPPEVTWTRIIRAREESYDAVVFIKNPNQQHGAPRLEYTVILRDANGVEIGKRANSTFLLPDEEVMIVEPDIRTPLIPNSVDFNVITVAWTREYTPHAPYDLGLSRRSHSIVETPRGSKESVVKTDIFNNTSERFSVVHVSIFLYDENRNIIGVNKTIVENLGAGETRPLEFVWPEAIQGTITSIEGTVRINEFIRK